MFENITHEHSSALDIVMMDNAVNMIKNRIAKQADELERKVGLVPFV